MVNKKILSLLLISILLTLTLQQNSDQDQFQVFDSQQPNQQVYQQQQLDQTTFGNPQFQGMSNQDKQRFASMKRTACLVLSRYHSNSRKQQVQLILKNLPVQKQQKFINKMYSTAIIACQKIIKPDQVQMLFIENRDFHPQLLFYLFDDVDYNKINLNSKITEQEKQIAKFIKKFDEQMEVRKQEQRAQQQKIEQSDQQIRIFWLSLRDFGYWAQIGYLLIVVLILGGFVWWVMNELGMDKSKQANKKKKKNEKKSS